MIQDHTWIGDGVGPWPGLLTTVQWSFSPGCFVSWELVLFSVLVMYVGQRLLKGHWKRHWQEVTVLNFQAFTAKVHDKEHGTVLRRHSDRSRLSAYDVWVLTVDRQLTPPTSPMSPSLFSGMNVLFFFRRGHTFKSLNLDLVIPTVRHSLLSIQNILHSLTFSSSLSLFFKLNGHSYECWIFDFV